jgi:hypothetical protein
VTQLVSAGKTVLAEELLRAATHASVELNIPQYGDGKMKICPIIEICRFVELGPTW